MLKVVSVVVGFFLFMFFVVEVVHRLAMATYNPYSEDE